MISAMPYYGGKASHLQWLLPLLPAFASEQVYLEPFCGSCAVALNRKHKADRIFLNDINGEVVNFFMVLRDNPGMLIQQLQLTPKSEREHKDAFRHNFDESTMPNVEAARRYGVKIYQSFGGIVREKSAGWRPGLLALDNNRIATFQDIVKTIRHFNFHNDDALSVIKRHNKPSVFIYADPPYLMETRTASCGYAAEFSNERDYHERFLQLAVETKARFAISGYSSSLYDETLADWYCYKNKTFAYTSSKRVDNKQPTRTEVLWCNYPPAANAQAELI